MNVTGTDLDLGSLALPKAVADSASAELGQEDFLTLMITQIQNQDPFAPMENGEFLGQLAQFSTVSGIADISQSVATLSEALLANQAMQASSMIGRQVLVESSQAELGYGQPVRGAVELPPGVSTASVRITDSSGQLVRTLEVRGRGGSMAHYEWDGITATGESARPGPYRLEASARNGRSDIALPGYVQVGVLSVALDAGGQGSVITTEDGQQLRFSQVRAVM